MAESGTSTTPRTHNPQRHRLERQEGLDRRPERTARGRHRPRPGDQAGALEPERARSSSASTRCSTVSAPSWTTSTTRSAERAVQLGATAFGSAQVVAERTKLPPYPDRHLRHRRPRRGADRQLCRLRQRRAREHRRDRRSGRSRHGRPVHRDLPGGRQAPLVPGAHVQEPTGALRDGNPAAEGARSF